jgi:hypothetical protein
MSWSQQVTDKLDDGFPTMPVLVMEPKLIGSGF